MGSALAIATADKYVARDGTPKGEAARQLAMPGFASEGVSERQAAEILASEVEAGPGAAERTLERWGGRKSGSRNKVTNDLLRLIAAKHGTLPLLTVAHYALGSIEKIKADFQCDTARAGEIKERFLLGMLPYTAKKMPLDVNATHTERTVVVIGQVDAAMIEGVANEDDEFSLIIDADPMKSTG